MRKCALFNDNWQFAAQKLSLDASDTFFAPITLPHSNKLFSHSNVDNAAYQFISTYRKKFFWHKLPENDPSLVFLDFDGVMLACEVYVNGRFLHQHLGGYAPFSVNITDVLQDGENCVTLHVDSRERKDVPRFVRDLRQLGSGDGRLQRRPGSR